MNLHDEDRFGWGSERGSFSPDETNHDLRQPLDTGIYPYIPKGRQQRSGLLIDFLSMHGTSRVKDHVDLLMLGENRFGVLLVNIPSSVGASDDDLLLLKSALRNQKSANSAAATLRALDKFFSENLKAAAGVQAFFVILDQQSRAINCSSAAHDPMLVFRPDQSKLFRVSVAGSALGLAPKAYKDFNGRLRSSLPDLKSELAQIRQHDLLVLYSPGVIEAKNAWGEPFGMQRFMKVVQKHGHKQPTPFLGEVQNALEQFTLGEPLLNDVTVIALKNMLPNRRFTPDGSPEPPDLEARFLTVEEETQLWRVSEKHPDGRTKDLMKLLGDRYIQLGHERIRSYLANGSKNGVPEAQHQAPANGARRYETREKSFQRQMLQNFPIRQLLYRKYEFRGNTTAIGSALDHYQNGRFQESLLEFVKVRKTIAESESVFCFFGNLYLLLNMSIKARQEYLKALKRNPRSVHAYLALGYISLLHGDYDGTINYLSIATRLDASRESYKTFLADLVRAIDDQNGFSQWVA